jgi:hypothetical protein
LFLPVLPDHLAACPQLSSSAHQLTIIPSPCTFKQICQQQKNTQKDPDRLSSRQAAQNLSPSSLYISPLFPSNKIPFSITRN